VTTNLNEAIRSQVIFMGNLLISQLYSIHINGSEDLESSAKVSAYEWDVGRLIIRGIATRQTGRIIMNAIRFSPGSVEVRPNKKPDCNAETTYKKIDADLTTVAVLVRFSPLTWGGSGKCFVDPKTGIPEPGAAPEEVLFHELVHAFRMVYGKRDTRPLGNSPHYTNKEDFFAVLITNIFSSETNRPLRASHQGHEPLADYRSSDEGFLQVEEYASMVREFVTTHRSVSEELRKVPSKFNPIRGVLVGQGFQYLMKAE
jgi:hypothetical protein